MEEGRVQWAQSGDAQIAFRVLGEGAIDLVFLGSFLSHIEVLLEEPGLRRWWERLGSIARVILLDRRGLGLSDPLEGPLSLADEVADVDAVLDAAGCDRVVVQAYAAGAPLSIEYALARRGEHWGTGANLDDMAPSVVDDPRIRAWLGKLERQSTTPAGMLRMAANLRGVDVRPHLPSLRGPAATL